MSSQTMFFSKLNSSPSSFSANHVLCYPQAEPQDRDTGPSYFSTPVHSGGYFPEFLPDVERPLSPILHTRNQTLLNASSPAPSLTSPSHPPVASSPSNPPAAKRKLSLAATRDMKRRKLDFERLKGTKPEG